MADALDSPDTALDRDVVVVGGGPAGCSAAVFTARYGLDTAVFDRGNAALRCCAFLANYLGFPAGIDVDAFYDLMHAHVAEAGGDLVSDMVESVEREDSEGFRVETQDGRSVTARYVVAAAWYDGEYLRPVVGDDAFELHEHHGEEHEHFDPRYPDDDGRTPVDGLYVAAPTGYRNAQAIISAGQGAHAARCLLHDHRRAQGYPEGVADHYDWLRPESEFSGEWGDRDRWREWFANEAGDDHDLDDERFAELREQYIDRAFETKVSEDAVEERADRGVRRLVEHLDADRVVDALDADRVLDAIDDERISAYLADGEVASPGHE